MAYFDKYEAKANYVDKVMSENAEIETLTEEQHDALRELCRIRHEMHCNQDDFFYSEHSNHSTFWHYIDETINSILTDANLPSINFDIDICDYELDYEVDYYDEPEQFEAAYDKCIKMASHVNDLIENYLLQIDKEHGTSYCPTGFARTNI